MLVGQVSQVWRHPVKSMRGDRVRSSAVTERWGLPGDRGWAIRDEAAGEIRSAKKMADLLQFHARYLEEPHGDSTPPIEITFPDGSVRRSDDEEVHDALSAALGREVRLWPRRPAEDREHYRRLPVEDADLRTQLGLGPHDPFPDFAGMPDEVLDELGPYITPRGTYFDAMPLSVLTTTAMRSLETALPGSRVDPRRFRKNIIVETDSGESGHPEFGWVGGRVRIGEVPCAVVTRVSRCRMVTLPQAELPHDRDILRALARENGTKFGVYLQSEGPGEIHEGDPVHLL